MGVGYAHAFYRYVARSARELIVTGRDDTGRIIAATVVSVEPATFNRRLLLHTPLLSRLVVHSATILADWWRAPRDTQAVQSPVRALDAMPSMLLIYTAAGTRGAGHGAALLRAVEAQLQARGVAAYQVRTELHPGNRALRFYDTNGFTRAGVAVRLGKSFQVFVRRLPSSQLSHAQADSTCT